MMRARTHKQWHLCTLRASYFWRVGSGPVAANDEVLIGWEMSVLNNSLELWGNRREWLTILSSATGGGCEHFVVQGDAPGAGPQSVWPTLLKGHDKLLSKEQMLFTEPFSSRPQLIWPLIGLWFLPALLLNVHLPGERKTGESWEQTCNGHTPCRRNRNRGNERELLLFSTYVSKKPTGT